ncbi:MAG: T9SS type A sorting domain-containing protein [Bacteroidia bacterium]|nr:T9SS type A sorting domain-containing protein [Bacteroidia bacterium]
MFLLLWIMPLVKLDAQPSLTFKRVTVNWPSIELYFTVDCDGKPYVNLTKENFSISENGVEVGPFTLWCPDLSSVYCGASLALVLDASGSMRGEAARESMRIAESLLIELLQWYEEAAVILAGGDTRVTAPMTTEKGRLRDGLAAYAPSGASALYDGIHAGLSEMIAHGVNQCRAVIVISDGEDNSSLHTMAEVVALANRHRIRVFTIGSGPIVQEDSLALLSRLTGGYYLNNPGYQKTKEVYDYITRSMIGGWGHGNECIITYDRDCADGSLRSVDLRLRDVCGGSDVKSKQYRAPFDSSTLRRFDIILPHARVRTAYPFSIGIEIDTRGDTVPLPPFELELRIDEALRYRSLSIPTGSTLDGVPLRIDTSRGSIIIRSMQPSIVTASGRLLDLELAAIETPHFVGSLVAIKEMRVGSGCYLPSIINHSVQVQPRIIISQPLCEGGNALLEGTPGFLRYLWSTGDTTRSIQVAAAGGYSLRVVDERGDTLIAEAVDVATNPLPQLRVGYNGAPQICPGGSLTLLLDGDVTGAKIRWSNGQEGPELLVREAGRYWASATNQYGCIGYSDTLTVSKRLTSVRIIPSGALTLCPGDSVELSLAGTFSDVRWNWNTFSSSLVVRWQQPDPQAERIISVRATDSSGCYGYDTVVVHMLLPQPLRITPGPKVALCDCEAVTLYADTGRNQYLWSTGDTTAAIEVRQPGIYIVTVDDTTGCLVADTVMVTSIAKPRPVISMDGIGLLCGDERVRLSAGPGWESYRWSTGARTEYIETDSSGSYWVEVTGYGGCPGSSDTVLVIREVEPVDFLPTIRGSQPLCPGDTLWLDGPEDMVLWHWNTGHRQRSLPVTRAGRYAVTVVTHGGCEQRSAFLDVGMTQSIPPEITRDGDVLRCGAAQSWQWHRNGQPIPGAVQQSVIARETGSYTVTIVDEYGCTMTSSPFPVTILGGVGAMAIPDDLLLYPEPASDWLHVVFPGPSRDARVTLVSLLGQVLMHREASGDSGARSMRIDLSDLPAGIYLLQANSGERWWVRKVVVRR